MPLLILENGSRLSNPSEKELAGQVGLQVEAKNSFYDLAIIGGGPAGLATAVYGGSEGLTTVLIEGSAPGGQAGTSSRIENYLGFPAGLSGSELTGRAVAQAKKFGVEMLTPRNVASLEIEGPYRHVELDDGSRISCHALMLSVGVFWRKLPAENAGEFTDKGVYYGAALTEVDNCAGDVVYTVVPVIRPDRQPCDSRRKPPKWSCWFAETLSNPRCPSIWSIASTRQKTLKSACTGAE